MARRSICTSCEGGKHRGYNRIIQAAPKDGVGGVICVCEGECRDGRYKKSLDQLLGLPEGSMARIGRTIK